MTTYKRVAGNLIVETTGATDTVTFQGPTANAATVVINGNLTVSGNAALTGNISGDNIFNGTTSIAIPVASGNAVISVGGTSNVAVWSTTGVAITGTESVTGNITGGNLSAVGNTVSANYNTTGNILLTHTSDATSLRNIRFTDSNTTVTTLGANIGAIEWFTNDSTGAGARVTARIRAVYSDANGNANIEIQTGATSTPTTRITVLGATGNVGIANSAPLHTFAVSGNTFTSGNASVIGNVSGGNILTGGLISATANIDGGNLRTAGLITATGNITGGNVVSLGAVSAGSAGVSATGNVTGGNINSNQLISATGNIFSGGNLLAQDNVSVTGNILGNELRVSNANISLNIYGTGNGVPNIIWQNVANTISSASMQNIGNLSFTALANQSYIFDSVLYVNTNGSATTTQFAVNFAAGTCNYTLESQTGAATSWSVATSNTSDSTGTSQNMAGTNAQRLVRISGTFTHTANTTVALRGQTSLANVTVASGSYLRYSRIG